MNSEQFKKINELVKKLGRIEEMLKRSDLSYAEVVEILGIEIIRAALIAYRDELKAELKELGYKDD